MLKDEELQVMWKAFREDGTLEARLRSVSESLRAAGEALLAYREKQPAKTNSGAVTAEDASSIHRIVEAFFHWEEKGFESAWGAILAVARPALYAERDAQWEKAVTDELYNHCDIGIISHERFPKSCFARLTAPTKKTPEERVAVETLSSGKAVLLVDGEQFGPVFWNMAYTEDFRRGRIARLKAEGAKK